MLNNKSLTDYKKIFRIGYLNLLLVLFGYLIVTRYGTDFQPILKNIRILFLIYSFYVLNKIVSFQNIKDNFSSKNLFFVFIILIFFPAYFQNIQNMLCQGS